MNISSKTPRFSKKTRLGRLVKIIPLVDKLFINYLKKDEINLLDVGGVQDLFLMQYLPILRKGMI